MFLCPCHLSLFDPLSVIKNVDEQGREVMAAELLEGPAHIVYLQPVPIKEMEFGLMTQLIGSNIADKDEIKANFATILGGITRSLYQLVLLVISYYRIDEYTFPLIFLQLLMVY